MGRKLVQDRRIDVDFCVVGGGVAGCCAAIAAARGGCRTVLVQDRPVLGGNSSSEIRVWVQGATAAGFNNFARETGILGELYLENLYRNREGNAHVWDAILYEYVTREPNVTLLLDTAVDVVAMRPGAPDLIDSVGAFSSLSQTRYTIRASLFADASGDGALAFPSGAEYRVGREARAELDESLAPEQADHKLLGSSMFFYTKRCPHPIRFVKPAFAIDVTGTTIPTHRQLSPDRHGCELWWIEYGGLLDTIHQGDEIKRHLYGLIHGIWDYIKNSGKFDDVENLALEWVGAVPGKRESRRFMGDHVLTQHDIMEQRFHDDDVAVGGWSIDLHPPEGIYSQDRPSSHVWPDWLYNIPFRCLYSRNVSNLLLAGRLISASHVAFGSIRITGTCSVCGQAVGTAAGICKRHGIRPRQIVERAELLQELQQRLLRDGQHILRARNQDEDDLARKATVTASSTAVLHVVEQPVQPYRLSQGSARITLPIARQRFEAVALLLDVAAPTALQYAFYTCDKPTSYCPNERRYAGRVQLSAGPKQWIELRPDAPIDERAVVWVYLERNEAVTIWLSAESWTGVLFESVRGGEDQIRHHGPHLATPCLRLPEPIECYPAEATLDGYHRPEGALHLWASQPIGSSGEWIELAWAEPQRIACVQLTFNADVNRQIWTHFRGMPDNVIQQIVRDYEVLAQCDGGWQQLAAVRGNYQHVNRISFEPVSTDRLRILVRATQGRDKAEMHEVRVYPPGA